MYIQRERERERESLSVGRQYTLLFSSLAQHDFPLFSYDRPFVAMVTVPWPQKLTETN